MNKRIGILVCSNSFPKAKQKQTVTVVESGKKPQKMDLDLSDCTNASFSNSSGGTEFLPPGRYRVEITGGFHDYETGQVVHARLLDEKDIATARKKGTSKYGSAYWRKMVETGDPQIKNPQEHLDRVLQAEAKFDPAKIAFHLTEGVFLPE